MKDKPYSNTTSKTMQPLTNERVKHYSEKVDESLFRVGNQDGGMRCFCLFTIPQGRRGVAKSYISNF